MSFLSTTENVGFSGIPQNISDASCATQYKMAVEGVSGNSEVNIFINDSSGDEQPYIPHFNDSYFHSKFKIDPSELYTFNDSDVIASEITVSNTEDNFIFPETTVKKLDSPNKEIDLNNPLSNGLIIKEEIKEEVVSNGHYHPLANVVEKEKPVKAQKVRTQSQGKEQSRTNSLNETRRQSVHSPKGPNASSSSKNSINSVSANHVKPTPGGKGSETFLDVFKREQGVLENSLTIKTEPKSPAPPMKVPLTTPKKPSAKSIQAKARKGRGPAVHEALQRIPAQKRALAVRNGTWHAPGEDLYHCGPLSDTRPVPFKLDSSSSDDDNTPDIVTVTGPVCVEESAAESRGARLALRRAALRRQVARVDTSLRLTKDYREHKTLTTLIRKQLSRQGPACKLSNEVMNHLLAIRGMPSLLSSQERRRLRECGWSNGSRSPASCACAEERCGRPALPAARHCAAHVARAPDQRLYAACAAVFAGGQRCLQPLLPLQDHTPLCAEHARKRDNYDKLSRDCRPKKAGRVRSGAKRRRRAAPRPRPAAEHATEINVCSNSSAYDSSEETAIGALSENEFIAAANNSHELEEEVGHVPPDDILDPSVLSQIPDEAFTEFFNQAEGGAAFAESSELAAALEAVLDERALDERVLDERALESIVDVFAHSPRGKTKVQVPASVGLEMSSSAPS